MKYILNRFILILIFFSIPLKLNAAEINIKLLETNWIEEN